MKARNLAATTFSALFAASLVFLPGVAGAQTGPGPQNMSALLKVRPLTDADGRAIGGRVGIELVVDPSGRITGCSVPRSSGNADLDRHACKEASERLEMKPATDAAGNPVEGRFRTTIAFAGGG